MILGAIDVGIAVAGACLSGWFLVTWVAHRAIVRRIEAQPTVRVADVSAGPVEIAGRLTVAGEPLRAIDGAEVAAFKRKIKAAAEGDDASRLIERVMTSSAELEVEDESGACILELDRMILLGPTATYTPKPDECREKHPEVWAIVTAAAEDLKVTSVCIEETVLPNGATGFISGEASPSDRVDPSGGGGYRGGARRLKVTGSDARPLIAAAWPEAEVLAFLRAPLRRTLAIALLALAVAALALVVPLLLTRHAGL